jgi:integrase
MRLTETRARRASLPTKEQRERTEWCSEVTGFGARILHTGVRSYIVMPPGHSRITLGRVGTLPFEGPPEAPGARDLAIVALNAARRGEDSRKAIGRAKQPKGATIGDIWKAYGDAGYPLLNKIGFKRASSIAGDRHRWSKHFVRIADEPAADFDTERTTRWLDTIAGTGARSHALIMLKGFLSFGASRGMCEPHKITLRAKPSREIQNFLKPEELKRLDAALVELSTEQPSRAIGFAAIRLLLHTGMRKGEVLGLEWSMVDLDHRVIRLPIDKASETGRTVLLTDAACDVLRSLPRLARGGWCFLGRRRDGHLIDIEYHFVQALERAGLRRIRIHDLRHSFASVAIGRGKSLHTVGKLLGHKSSRTTERYAHLSAEAAREALDSIADALS